MSFEATSQATLKSGKEKPLSILPWSAMITLLPITIGSKGRWGRSWLSATF